MKNAKRYNELCNQWLSEYRRTTGRDDAYMTFDALGWFHITYTGDNARFVKGAAGKRVKQVEEMIERLKSRKDK